MTIQNVSDTARWVAVYRAMETARPDAIFRDPYAERLAGAEGVTIVNEMKQGRGMAWAMIVRTAVLDEMRMMWVWRVMGLFMSASRRAKMSGIIMLERSDA